MLATVATLQSAYVPFSLSAYAPAVPVSGILLHPLDKDNTYSSISLEKPSLTSLIRSMLLRMCPLDVFSCEELLKLQLYCVITMSISHLLLCELCKSRDPFWFCPSSYSPAPSTVPGGQSMLSNYRVNEWLISWHVSDSSGSDSWKNSVVFFQGTERTHCHVSHVHKESGLSCSLAPL